MRLPANLKRLAKMLPPYRNRIFLALLGMLVTAGTEPTLTYLMGQLLDKGFVGKLGFPIWMVPLCLIGIFVVRGVSTFMTTYMMTWVTSRLQNDLRRGVFTKLLDVPLGFYAKHPTGKVINSMMFETQQIIDMVKNVITSLIRDALTALGLLVMLLYYNWKLTLITLVLVPTTAYVVRKTGKRLQRLTQNYLGVNAELTQVLEETTRAQQVIKIFGGQAYERDRFEQRAEKLRSYSMRMSNTFAATVPITQVIAACALSIVVVIALVQANAGEATVGTFVAFISAMLMLLTPLKRIAEVNGPLQRGLAASDAVFEMIDAEPERIDGKTLDHRARGELHFVDVGITYPGAQRPALSHINLTIRPGENVAFVGMSGGGKSTLVNLVPEFFQPDLGEIRLDGVPIRELSLQSLRRQIAMVSQHVVLFDDTVAANIAYGDANPDRARVAAAAKAAHLDSVIANLPQGLDTVIGDNGNRLSGGQRQRLAIARAIYKDAPILILDEATSALDTESERAVQAALDELMRGRTTLVIAHRLSTIERADRIVVLTEGRIVESGSHAELLARNGVYATLYQLQFAKESV
ncbi:lipid A export permease/ATP-binding protein MsbA [Oxalobacteraceae bacterium OM1]|nr:lipid A export permease/ATP-binding protein MsbA [Oxalobacteraceae bacterium OM1]